MNMGAVFIFKFRTQTRINTQYYANKFSFCYKAAGTDLLLVTRDSEPTEIYKG